MGKFKFALLAVMAMWSCAVYAQSENTGDAARSAVEQEIRQSPAVPRSSEDMVLEPIQKDVLLARDQDPGNEAMAGAKEAAGEQPTQAPDPQWQYGGFLDVAYLVEFNHPANDMFLIRGTAYNVGEPVVKMAGPYHQKSTSTHTCAG